MEGKCTNDNDGDVGARERVTGMKSYGWPEEVSVTGRAAFVPKLAATQGKAPMETL